MSVVNQLNSQLFRMNLSPFRRVNLSVPQKVTILSVSLGVALLGFLARYLRRRRHGTDSVIFRKQLTSRRGRAATSGVKSPGSEPPGSRRSASPGFRGLYRQPSISGASDRASGVSASTFVHEAGELTPQQLGHMDPVFPLHNPENSSSLLVSDPSKTTFPNSLRDRMEALETAINYWEDALAAYTSTGGPLTVTSTEEAEFSRQLQELLDSAYRLQDESELLFLDQRSVLFRTDSSSGRAPVDDDNRRRIHTLTSASSLESFASAQDELEYYSNEKPDPTEDDTLSKSQNDVPIESELNPEPRDRPICELQVSSVSHSSMYSSSPRVTIVPPETNTSKSVLDILTSYIPPMKFMHRSNEKDASNFRSADARVIDIPEEFSESEVKDGSSESFDEISAEEEQDGEHSDFWGGYDNECFVFGRDISHCDPCF